MPRKMMSCSIDWADPQSTDPITNIVNPNTRNTFRPYRSDSLPAMGVIAVEVSMYIVNTQDI
ncbi:hypothetical protein D3C81_2053990 [compost metagenome]